MNFIIGGKAQGKLDYALNTFNLNKEDIFNCEKLEDEKEINFEMLKSKKAIYKFHILIKVLLKYNTPENTKNLIKELLEEKRDYIIIADEIGYGVVPIDNFERMYREVEGRICCEVVKNSEKVYRVICGIGTIIKG